jgi:hypothetical protein
LRSKTKRIEKEHQKLKQVKRNDQYFSHQTMTMRETRMKRKKTREENTNSTEVI